VKAYCVSVSTFILMTPYFTRPIAGHMFANYDGVLKIDGEVGNKKAYDPRAWGKIGEAGMAERIVSACEHLSSTGTSVSA